jgi:hypothetical protein
MEQYSAVQQCSKVQWSAVQYSAVGCGTSSVIALQCCAVRCATLSAGCWLHCSGIQCVPCIGVYPMSPCWLPKGCYYVRLPQVGPCNSNSRGQWEESYGVMGRKGALTDYYFIINSNSNSALFAAQKWSFVGSPLTNLEIGWTQGDLRVEMQCSTVHGSSEGHYWQLQQQRTACVGCMCWDSQVS